MQVVDMAFSLVSYTLVLVGGVFLIKLMKRHWN